MNNKQCKTKNTGNPLSDDFTPEFILEDGKDEVSELTSWDNLEAPTSNYETRSFIEKNTILTTKNSLKNTIIGLVFFLTGLFFCGSMAQDFFDEGFYFDPEIFILLLPLIFCVIGFFIIKGRKSFNFDKGLSKCYTGSTPENSDDCHDLDSIHALQLLSRHVSGEDSSYTCYQLNLVFKDGERLNVLSHGSLKGIHESSQKISHFLKIPIWSTL